MQLDRHRGFPESRSSRSRRRLRRPLSQRPMQRLLSLHSRNLPTPYPKRRQESSCNNRNASWTGNIHPPRNGRRMLEWPCKRELGEGRTRDPITSDTSKFSSGLKSKMGSSSVATHKQALVRPMQPKPLWPKRKGGNTPTRVAT